MENFYDENNPNRINGNVKRGTAGAPQASPDKRSKMLNASRPNLTVQAMPTSTLYIGKLLGEGGFCQIRELCSSSPSSPFRSGRASSRKKELKVDQMNVRGSVVLKSIKFDKDPSSLLMAEAIADLRREAVMLSSLDHPNIISFFGSFKNLERNSSPSFDEDDSTAAPSLVLERLDGTLTKRFSDWRKKYRMASPTAASAKSRNMVVDPKQKKQRQAMTMEKLSVARDVASAMAYLHEQNILHRDLKPENIGFNMDGTVKLFDFGMSRALPAKSSSSSSAGSFSGEEKKSEEVCCNDTFKMSGGTGTIRYMAPEVALHLPYNCSADVYSFAIMLWEMWTLKIAFDSYHHLQNFVFLVAESNLRPDIPQMGDNDPQPMPEFIADLMQRSWATRKEERPKFAEIHDVLDEFLSVLSQQMDDQDAPLSVASAKQQKVPASTSSKRRMRSFYR